MAVCVSCAGRRPPPGAGAVPAVARRHIMPRRRGAPHRRESRPPCTCHPRVARKRTSSASRAAGSRAASRSGRRRAVRASDPRALVEALVAARLEYYRRLKIYATFGKGWESRVAEVRKQALLMAAV